MSSIDISFNLISVTAAVPVLCPMRDESLISTLRRRGRLCPVAHLLAGPAGCPGHAMAWAGPPLAPLLPPPGLPRSTWPVAAAAAPLLLLLAQGSPNLAGIGTWLLPRHAPCLYYVWDRAGVNGGRARTGTGV